MPTPQHSASPAHVKEDTPHGARIKVVGVGGAGNNAINRMIASGMAGVEFVALNTDIQALRSSAAEVREQIGTRLTNGLGAGSDPDIGRRAALQDSDKILEALDGADMVFVTAGLGGGTGTGAAPVIAALASEMGALTVAVVTRPFGFEGKRRMAIADWGVHHLLDYVDTLIVIPNEKLLAIARDAPFFESFRVADDFLRDAVQGISDIVTTAGVINRDFADVKAIMAGMGYAVMGTASRSGPTRAMDAITDAVASPLLEAGAINGARGILINITGSSSLRLSEVNDASTMIQSLAHEDANIIFGAVLDERLGDEVKVTVIATGFRDDARDRSERRARLTGGAEKERAMDTPVILSPDPSILPIANQEMRSLNDNSEVHPQGPEPLQEEQRAEAPGNEPSPEFYGGEEDWKDAIREIAFQAESSLELAGLAHDGPNDLSPPNATAHPAGLSEEDFAADGPATLSSLPADPDKAPVALQRHSVPPPQVEAVAPAPGPSSRQAAIAAYSIVAPPEPEPRHGSSATVFAEILQARQTLVEPLNEGNSSSDSWAQPGKSSILEPYAHPTVSPAPAHGIIQEGTLDLSNAPVSRVSTSGVAAPPGPAPPGPATAEDLPTPLPEFNRRLHRDHVVDRFWETSQANAERQVRVPSFASGPEDERYNDEFDELDIPAFLRRGN